MSHDITARELNEIEIKKISSKKPIYSIDELREQVDSSKLYSMHDEETRRLLSKWINPLELMGNMTILEDSKQDIIEWNKAVKNGADYLRDDIDRKIINRTINVKVDSLSTPSAEQYRKIIKGIQGKLDYPIVD